MHFVGVGRKAVLSGVKFFPDALKLLQEQPHILGVLHNQNVLTAVLDGLCGPIEGAPSCQRWQTYGACSLGPGHAVPVYLWSQGSLFFTHPGAAIPKPTDALCWRQEHPGVVPRWS